MAISMKNCVLKFVWRQKKKKRDSTMKEPEEWEEVLAPLGTDHIKEHITDAPWVVVIFRHSKRKGRVSWLKLTLRNHVLQLDYSSLLSIIWVCLPYHTFPMGFLREILDRPAHEHPMLLLPVGFPEGARV